MRQIILVLALTACAKHLPEPEVSGDTPVTFTSSPEEYRRLIDEATSPRRVLNPDEFEAAVEPEPIQNEVVMGDLNQLDLRSVGGIAMRKMMLECPFTTDMSAAAVNERLAMSHDSFTYDMTLPDGHHSVACQAVNPPCPYNDSCPIDFSKCCDLGRID